MNLHALVKNATKSATRSVIIISAFSLASCASNPCSGLYGKIGAGYNLNTGSVIQTEVYDENPRWIDESPYTARFELGTECYDNLTVGYSHMSQWLEGWPVNKNKEVARNEVFVDYKFRLR